MSRPYSADLREWGTFGPELVRLLSEFEEGINRSSKSQTVFPHHEHIPAFQQQFTSNVRRVFKNFSYNSFEQEGLVEASNVNISYPECVHKALGTLLIKGEFQFSEFWNSWFIRSEIPIDQKITNNVFSIPGCYEKNQKESEKRLVCPVTVLMKLS